MEKTNLIGAFKPNPYKDKKINTLFNQLTLDSLDEINNSYYLRDTHKLSKEALINRMVEVYPKVLMRLLSYLTIDELNLILACVQQDGLLLISKCNIDDITIPYYLGLVFVVEKDSQYYIVVADELRQWLDQADLLIINKKAIQTSYLKQYIIGIVNLYGVFSIDLFITLYKQQNKNTKLDIRYFYELINLYDVYDGYFHVIGHNDYIYHYRAETYLYQLIHEVESKHHKQQYCFTKEQILEAGQKDYCMQNDVFQEISLYLQSNIGNKAVSQALAQDLYYLAVSGQFKEAINFIVTEEVLFNMPDLHKFIKLYINFTQQIYQWTLKGNSKINKLRGE